MKYAIILIAIFSIEPAESQNIYLEIDLSRSSFFKDKYKDDAVKAFNLASDILSSEEFRRSLATESFSCLSYCKSCTDTLVVIDGRTIFAQMLVKNNLKLGLALKRNGGALGETYADATTTKAWYKPIIKDMPELLFYQGLAVNICHEYMHILGYCHMYCTNRFTCPKEALLNEPDDGPDMKFRHRDVTYGIGWIAYDVVTLWRESGRLSK